MFDRLRTKQSAITFDVGSTGVRACQLAARGREIAVRDLLRIELTPQPAKPAPPADAAAEPPPGASSSRSSAAPAAEVTPACDAQRLARMMSQGSFAGRDVALLLSPPEIRFHTLRLPDNILSQPEERIRAALSFEVSREARCEPHELEVRHWPLPPGHQQGLNVMAVSLPSRRAMEWFDAFAQRKLNLRRLDASPCALVRLALQSWTPSPKDLWAVLECGFRQSVLTVVVGDQPAYVRCLTASTDQWTRRLADAFDLSYAEAEELKRAHGICPQETDGSAPGVGTIADVDSDQLPAVVFGVLREPLDALVREIDLCCSYVMRSYSDLNVCRLFLAGGGANLHGMKDYLSLHLGVAVAIIDAAIGTVDHDAAGRDCASAAAIGGALLDLEAA